MELTMIEESKEFEDDIEESEDRQQPSDYEENDQPLGKESDVDNDSDDVSEPINEGETISNKKPEKLVDKSNMDLSEQELDEIADTTIEVIRELLYFFEAETAEIEEFEGDEGELIFDVVGDNLAMLIGRHGRTLESMQYLVSAIVSKRLGFHYPVIIDVEGYINRRRQKLITLAKSSAAKAIRQKRSVRLRPMSPYERRIIHMALKEDRRVKTESEGVEPNRQVVIHFTR